jgi:hypothetical protein
MKIVRNILAVVLGIVIGGMVNMAFIVAGPQVFPPPEGVNMGDAKSLAEGAHLLQPRHFVFPFIAHAAGTFVGALVAHLVAASHRNVFSYVVGCFNLLGGIIAASMIPAPVWFIALDLLVAYIPMAWLATRLGARIRPAATLSPSAAPV